MSTSPLRLFWVAALLAACASTAPSSRGQAEGGEASWEEACREEQSLVFLCDDASESCAFFRCRDFHPGQIVETQGIPFRPPTSSRRWNSRRWLAGRPQPVFVIPWKFHGRPPRPPEPKYLPSGRWERHHIFPQALDLAVWFKQQGVGIHQYTVLLPAHVHARLHAGAPRGGLWNDAWRRFREERPNAKPEEIWSHAGRLMYIFEINGPIVPYR
jgi:uncharacterized lipoprotein (TIGR02269 family)